MTTCPDCDRPMGDGDRVLYGQCGPCHQRRRGRRSASRDGIREHRVPRTTTEADTLRLAQPAAPTITLDELERMTGR